MTTASQPHHPGSARAKHKPKRPRPPKPTQHRHKTAALRLLLLDLERRGQPCSLHTALKTIRTNVYPHLTTADLLEVVNKFSAGQLTYEPRTSLLRLTPPASPATAPRVVTGWRARKADLERLLVDPAVDTVRVRLRSDDSTEARIRVDRVWLLGSARLAATFLAGSPMLEPLGESGASPLREWVEGARQGGRATEALEGISLLRAETTEAMTATILRTAMLALGPRSEAMRTSSLECVPRELDRRLKLWIPPRARGPHRGPALTHCAACGQPLSDTLSVQRGYGPECWRRLTSHERATQQPSSRRNLVALGSKPEERWLKEVLSDSVPNGWLRTQLRGRKWSGGSKP